MCFDDKFIVGELRSEENSDVSKRKERGSQDFYILALPKIPYLNVMKKHSILGSVLNCSHYFTTDLLLQSHWLTFYGVTIFQLFLLSVPFATVPFKDLWMHVCVFLIYLECGLYNELDFLWKFNFISC